MFYREPIVTRTHTWEPTREKGEEAVAATLRLVREGTIMELRRGTFQVLLDGDDVAVDRTPPDDRAASRARPSRITSQDRSVHEPKRAS